MTFMHKLSRRLAMLKDRKAVVSTAALAVVGILACEKPLVLTDPPPDPVSRVVVSPKVYTLRQYEVADFVAVGLTSRGDTASLAVSWSVTSGGLTDTSTSNGRHYGRYHAGSDTGKVKVVATGHPGGVADTAVVTVTPAPVTSVMVTPTSASVLQGQTLQLTATIKDSAGNVLSGRAVTWTSSDASVATVSSSGLVGAVAAGSVTITATSEGRSGTAAIVVANTPVASVVVSPASAGVLVGGTVQLAASPRDAAGNALAGRTVTWASSNNGVATVNGSGVVTGVTVGSATITATSEAKSGTGAITVTAPPPPPGGTILVRETFEDGAFASRGWYDNTGIATTTAEHIPGSTRALEAHFPAGATTPTWGGAARRLFTETESVYLSYWVKYSANWVGSGQAFHPHEFLLLTNENDPYVGPSFTHLTAYVEHNYQNGGLPVLQLQDGQNIDQGRIAQNLTTVTENRAVAGCNGNSDGYATGCYDTGGGVYNNEKKWIASRPYFTPTPGTGYKSDWHLVEAFFQLNSIQSSRGVADGIVRYWFDGQLVIEHTNVLLRTGAHPNMKFNQLAVAPYIGSGSPVDQTMWVDDLTVASARP